MDPIRIPALKQSMLLIEVHEEYVPGLLERLKARFAPSHNAKVINSRVRKPEDLPRKIPLTPRQLEVATDEGRKIARWLLLTPRGPAA
jgi:hypothetical protein